MVKLIDQPTRANFLGQIYMFLTGVDGGRHYISQTAHANGWTGWFSLGAPPNVSLVGSPAAVDAPDKVNLACRAVRNNGALFLGRSGTSLGPMVLSDHSRWNSTIIRYKSDWQATNMSDRCAWTSVTVQTIAHKQSVLPE